MSELSRPLALFLIAISCSLAVGRASATEILLDTFEGDDAVQWVLPDGPTIESVYRYDVNIGNLIPGMGQSRGMSALSSCDSTYSASSSITFAGGVFQVTQHLTAGPVEHYAWADFGLYYHAANIHMDMRPYSAFILHGHGSTNASQLVRQMILWDASGRARYHDVRTQESSLGDIVFDLLDVPYFEEPGFLISEVQSIFLSVGIVSADPPMVPEETALNYQGDSIGVLTTQPVAVKRTTWGALKSRFR